MHSCNKNLRVMKSIYCSNKCQRDHGFEVYVLKWKIGKVSGNRRVNAKNISSNVRRYLLTKANYSCSLCGWHKKNRTTGTCPLEVDHLDGDSENNRENNLLVLCPNCHSLTPNFRNLNRGNGREWSKLKYIKA